MSRFLQHFTFLTRSSIITVCDKEYKIKLGKDRVGHVLNRRGTQNNNNTSINSNVISSEMMSNKAYWYLNIKEVKYIRNSKYFRIRQRFRWCASKIVRAILDSCDSIDFPIAVSCKSLILQYFRVFDSEFAESAMNKIISETLQQLQ